MDFTIKTTKNSIEGNFLSKNNSVSPKRPTVSRKSLIRNDQKVAQIIDRTDKQPDRMSDSINRRRGKSDLLNSNLLVSQNLKIGLDQPIIESKASEFNRSDTEPTKLAKPLQLPFNLKTLPSTSDEVEMNFVKDYFQKNDLIVAKSSQGSPFAKGAIKTSKKYSFEQKGQKYSDKESTSGSNKVSKRLTESQIERVISETASPDNRTTVFKDSFFRLDKSFALPSFSMTVEKPKPNQPLPFIKSRITHSKCVVGQSAKEISKSTLLPEDSQSNIKIVHRKSNYSKPLADVFKSEPISIHSGLKIGLAENTNTSYHSRIYYYPTIHKYLSHFRANKTMPESSLLSHLREVHDVVQNLSDYLTASPSLLLSRQVNLLDERYVVSKNYLVLDIDETLVHSSKQRPVRIGDQSTLRYKAISILIGSEETKLYVCLRPFLSEFIQSVSDHYNIILFTSATEDYAQEIKDLIDPKGVAIQQVLSRSHCVFSKKESITKDLRIFVNQDPNRILLVDNSASAFANQLASGIPIVPFEGNPNDCELPVLSDYLMQLASEQNPVRFNQQYFSFNLLKNESDVIKAFHLYTDLNISHH